MPCRVPKRRFSCGAPQHLTKNPKNCGAFGTAVFLIFLLPRPAALSQGCTFFAHGTLFRFIGFYIKTQERFRADTKVHFAAAAVYEEADTNGNAAFALDDIEHFPDTAARSYNIFHHKDTGSRFDGKAPLEGHLAIDSFRKEESRSKVLCHFIGQENAARHRTDNKFHIVVDEPAGNFLAELFRIFRALQDIEFFHIDGTMKSAREEKMAMHDSIGFFEHTQDTFVIHEGHLPFLSRSD